MIGQYCYYYERKDAPDTETVGEIEREGLLEEE